MKDLQT